MNWENIKSLRPDMHVVNVLFCGQKVHKIDGKNYISRTQYSLGSIEYGKIISNFKPDIDVSYYYVLGTLGSDPYSV